LFLSLPLSISLELEVELPMANVFFMEFSSTLGTLDFDIVGALGGSLRLPVLFLGTSICQPPKPLYPLYSQTDCSA